MGFLPSEIYYFYSHRLVTSFILPKAVMVALRSAARICKYLDVVWTLKSVSSATLRIGFGSLPKAFRIFSLAPNPTRFNIALTANFMPAPCIYWFVNCLPVKNAKELDSEAVFTNPHTENHAAREIGGRVRFVTERQIYEPAPTKKPNRALKVLSCLLHNARYQDAQRCNALHVRIGGLFIFSRRF